MTISLKNNMGINRNVKTGFSCTTLLFAFFVPLFRGDFKWFFVMLISSLITSGISILVFPFFYNDIYIKSQIDKGWQPVSEEGKAYVQKIYQQNPIKKVANIVIKVFLFFIFTACISAFTKWYKLEENRQTSNIQQVEKKEVKTSIPTKQVTEEKKQEDDRWNKCEGKNDGIHEQDNKEEGKKVFYCKNGKTEWREDYKKNGKLDGKYFADTKTFEFYNEDGEIEAKLIIFSDVENFIDNNIGTATQEEYYPSGKLKIKKNIVDSEEVYAEIYYPNGNLSVKRNVTNGKIVYAETYYENGIISSVRKEEYMEGYYENGNLYLTCEFKDGELHGKMEEYNIKGELLNKVLFEHGKAVEGYVYDYNIPRKMTKAELYNNFNKK